MVDAVPVVKHQLHLMKANSRGLAKSGWYEWKLGWIEGLHSIADKRFTDLEDVSGACSYLP
jgi:hypothetical protein